MWDTVREWGSGRRWTTVALWASVGLFLGLVPLSLGSMLLLTPVLLAILLAFGPLLRPPSPGGLVLGVGLALLCFGLFNSAGPGSVCDTAVDGYSCTEYADPWPWWIAGGVVVAAGALLELWSRVRLGRSDTATT